MRKCGFCRQPNKILNQCWVLREGLYGLGARPNFWQIEKFITVYLCKNCSQNPYTLKHLKLTFQPIILVNNYFSKK